MLCSESIGPLSLVRCYSIGMISMPDRGDHDDKIIAIPFEDPTYNSYRDINELPSHIYHEMSHFFSVYKSLERKETLLKEVRGPEAAKAAILEAIDAYVRLYCR